MNRVVILMLVALAVFFCNVNVLWAADSNSATQTKSSVPAKTAKPKVTPKTTLKSDANAPAEPNIIEPNNEPNEKGKWQQDVNDTIERMEQRNQDESREWTQRSAENRINRLKSLDNQVTEEFNLIRKIALEEKAAKTVEVIDRVLEARKERLGKLIGSIEDANKKEERRKELQEKKQKEIEERRRRLEQQRNR